MLQAHRWFVALIAVVAGIMLGGCESYKNYDITVRFEPSADTGKQYPTRNISLAGFRGVAGDHPVAKSVQSQWFTDADTRNKAQSYDITLSNSVREVTLKKDDPQWAKWNASKHATYVWVIANLPGQPDKVKRLLPLSAKCWDGNAIVINVGSESISLDEKTRQILPDNPPD
jgi:hypothetical protein